mgnify:CR=1 FL=1|jgi:hypothetical protein
MDRILDHRRIRVRGDFALASLDESDDFLEGIDADAASPYIGGLCVVGTRQRGVTANMEWGR